MDAYVGAVYVGNGFSTVLNWITSLVDPAPRSQGQQGQFVGPDVKRSRTESPMAGPSMSVGVHGVGGMGGYGHYPSFQQPFQPSSYTPTHHPPPPPPSAAPPPLPPQPLPPNPLNPAQPQSAFLPLFNQTAQQRRLEVSYPAQFSGPAHAGRWTVQCLGTFARFR